MKRKEPTTDNPNERMKQLQTPTEEQPYVINASAKGQGISHGKPKVSRGKYTIYFDHLWHLL